MTHTKFSLSISVENISRHDGIENLAVHKVSPTMTSKKQQQRSICVIGGGAAGMSCAWALARDPSQRFRVTLLERAPVAGGVATSERFFNETKLNDGVQGGSASYANSLKLLDLLGLKPHWVDVTVSFGQGEKQWSNHHETVSPVIRKHKHEIRKFGKLLRIMKWCPSLFAFVKIQTLLTICGFSKDFGNDIVFPMTALFFGTGNQTANVSSAIFGEVFNNSKLKLYDYDHDRFVGVAPKMFAFPLFSEYYAKYAQMIRDTGNAELRFDTCVDKVIRESNRVEVYCSSGKTTSFQDFDDVVFCCSSEVAQGLLEAGSGTTRMERWVFSNVCWYDDVTVTHTDEHYMKKHYDLSLRPNSTEESSKKNQKKNNDMYFVRTYPEDRSKIEMSFDLSHYQPTAKTKEGSSSIYQTIFLNKKVDEGLWTIDKIDPTKILLKKWWRQFDHSTRHFTRAVPCWRFLQGKHRTYFAGSHTLVNTHEIAAISGFAAAYRLGAEYPFVDDELAVMQFDLYLSLIHGCKRR